MQVMHNLIIYMSINLQLHLKVKGEETVAAGEAGRSVLVAVSAGEFPFPRIPKWMLIPPRNLDRRAPRCSPRLLSLIGLFIRFLPLMLLPLARMLLL